MKDQISFESFRNSVKRRVRERAKILTMVAARDATPRDLANQNGDRLPVSKSWCRIVRGRRCDRQPFFGLESNHMKRYLNQLSYNTVRYLVIVVCLFSLTWASTAEAQFMRSPFYGVGVSRAYRPLPPLPTYRPIPRSAYRPSFVPPIPPVPRLRSPYVAVPVPVPGAVLQRRAYSYPYVSTYPSSAYRYGYGASPYSSFSLRVDAGPSYGPRSYAASSYGAYAVPVPLPRVSITRSSSSRSIYDGTIQATPETTDFGVGSFGPLAPVTNNSLSPIPNTKNAGDVGQSLYAAASRLERSLARRGDDSEVWLDYLAPNKIVSMLHDGAKREAFGDILKNFDGVAANSDLASITSVDGFAETRQLLREFVGEPPEDDFGGSIVDSDPVAPELKTQTNSTSSEVTSELPTPVPDPEPAGPTLAAPIAPADNGDTE